MMSGTDNSCSNYALTRTGKYGGTTSSRSVTAGDFLKKCGHSVTKQEIKLIDHSKTAQNIFLDVHGHVKSENITIEASCSVIIKKK
jgi:hypothetical protein